MRPGTSPPASCSAIDPEVACDSLPHGPCGRDPYGPGADCSCAPKKIVLVGHYILAGSPGHVVLPDAF